MKPPFVWHDYPTADAPALYRNAVGDVRQIDFTRKVHVWIENDGATWHLIEKDDQ